MYLWFESWAWHAACKPPSMLAENLTTESQGLCSAASVSIAAHYYPLFEVLHTHAARESPSKLRKNLMTCGEPHN
eukprot:scaffold53682_cov21-Tisochrysis_lutea.AAC.4